MREAMRLVLEREGFDIDEASDGDQALAAVKGDPATAEVRVIVVTATGEEGRAAAMAGGADHYFTKPFSPIALLEAVEEVLGPES